MRTAGKFPGITDDDHIQIRKLPHVRESDYTGDNGFVSGIFVCHAPEIRDDRLSTQTLQGLRLGVLITAWHVSDGDLFDDIGRILHWRRQIWIPDNGLNRTRYSLASTSMTTEMEAGPVFDAGAWMDSIDQTSVVVRALTRTATV
jgi:hypothetical protein